MNVRKSYGLIHIGLIIRLLANLPGSVSVGYLLKHIDKLEAELLEADLFVSLSALKNLTVFKEAKSKLKKIEGDSLVGEEQSSIIRTEVMVLEKTIFSESITKKIFIIPQRRYNGEYLLLTPDKILKEGIFNKLTEMARFDFASSCRCLSFGEGTASAFHILRATEDTLNSTIIIILKQNE